MRREWKTVNMHFRRSDAIYGAFGLVSGLLTVVLLHDWLITPLSGLDAQLGVRGCTLRDCAGPMLPAGVPFGLALTGATAFVLGFQPRQLLIIPFVLIGWFCAFRSWVWVGLLFRPEVGVFVSFFVAGAIGALITALGISLATRRRLTRYSYLAIILTGALVAEAWFVAMIGAHICCDSMPELLPPYTLFSLWQALVALAIGRSTGILAHGNGARRANISKEPAPPHTGSQL
jgi:hypothetical protein